MSLEKKDKYLHISIYDLMEKKGRGNGNLSFNNCRNYEECMRVRDCTVRTPYTYLL